MNAALLLGDNVRIVQLVLSLHFYEINDVFCLNHEIRLVDMTMVPRSIVWTDGHEYAIDRVKDIRSAPALKAGGQGDRYTVVVAGKERFLFFEHNADYGNERIGRWFVEVKNPDYGE